MRNHPKDCWIIVYSPTQAVEKLRIGNGFIIPSPKMDSYQTAQKKRVPSMDCFFSGNVTGNPMIFIGKTMVSGSDFP